MKKQFAVVAGPRLSGKTTIAGTLPGKTVLVQAAVHESGCRSAHALAKRRGNDLVSEGYEFANLVEFWAKMDKAAATDAQHIYIDGFSAINDMSWMNPQLQKLLNNDEWKGLRKHGDEMTALLTQLKSYSYKDKHVWLTCALKVEPPKGNEAADVRMECKGKMAVTAITKLGETVVSVVRVPGPDGKSQRMLLTQDEGAWPGRIDGVLDDANPRLIEPDLSEVLKLVEKYA